MKTGSMKRALSGFLAILLIVTGIAWDFGKTKTAEASESTAGEVETYIDFTQTTVDDLGEKGYASTFYNDRNNLGILGTASVSPNTHWSITSEAGLEPNVATTNEGSYRYVLETPYSYTDFKVSTKMVYGYGSGVMLKGANACFKAAHQEGVFIYFYNEGMIQILGGLDFTAANVTATGGTYTSLTTYGNFTFEDTDKPALGTELTLNVRKEGSQLTIWVSEYKASVTFNFTESYTHINQNNQICLVSRGNDEKFGSFKTLEVTQNTDTYIDFENIDVTGLNDYFTATQFNKSTKAVIGTEHQEASALWYSGLSGTYNTTGDHTSQNFGLKPFADTNDTYNHVLNYKTTQKNFSLTLEMPLRANIGVVLGEKNANPTNETGQTAIFLWSSGGTAINMRGAYDGSTLRVNEELKAEGDWQTAPTLFQNEPAQGEIFELHIELCDGLLKVWAESEQVISVEVSSTFVTDCTVALWSRNYTGSDTSQANNTNGFKSFSIQDLDQTYNFETIDTTAETNVLDTDFEASKYVKSPQSVSSTGLTPTDYWYTGESATDTNQSNHAGLKPIASNTATSTSIRGDYYMFLYYNTPYQDYKAAIELRQRESSSNIGFVLGSKNILTTNIESQVAAYTNDKNLIVRGAIDWNDFELEINGITYTTKSEVETAEVGSFGNNNSYSMPHVSSTPSDGTVHPIDIEVKDRYLTIEIGYSRLRIRLLDSFPTTSYVGLWCEDYPINNGGFKSFAIRELHLNTGTTVDVDGYTDFDHVDVSAFDEKKFTSTRFTVADGAGTVVEGEEDQAVSKHWFAGMTSDDGAATSENVGLKPNTLANEYTTFLNTPYTYVDFRISTEVYWAANVGIALGKKNFYPTKADETSVRIYCNADQIQLVGGGLDYSTAEVSGGGTKNTSDSTMCIFQPVSFFQGEFGKVIKLNVEMKGRVLYVWVDGYEGRLSVRTKNTFMQENIALMMKGYDGDSNKGGFKSLQVTDLTPEDYINFENMDAAVLGDTYTSTAFTITDSTYVAQETVAASEQWQSETGLQLQSTVSYALLNIPVASRNFEVEERVYFGEGVGLTFGKEEVWPTSHSDNAITVYLYNHDGTQASVRVRGAVEYSAGTVSGEGASWQPYQYTNGDIGGFFFLSQDNAFGTGVYTLHVRYEFGNLTIWVDGFEGKLTVPVTEHYRDGLVALRSQGNGGISGVATTELAEYIGDVNNNGKRNAEDINIIRRVILNDESSYKTKYVDLSQNQDGICDSRDLVAMIKLLDSAGEIDAYESLATTVYIDDSGSDETGDGTADAPYKTLSYAAEKVARVATVNITSTYTPAATEVGAGVKGKTITLTGGTLDLMNADKYRLAGNMTWDALTVTNITDDTIWAQGYQFKVTESVQFGTDGTEIAGALYGGVDQLSGITDFQVASTSLDICGGNYNKIYGGGNGTQVTGDTNVILGGSVNSAKAMEDHEETFAADVFAGGKGDTILGNATLTVKNNAKLGMGHGGGEHGKVNGTCTVNVEGGKAFGYYGGGYGSATDVSNTVVHMKAGETEQIFGGSDRGWVNGTATVNVTGGTITRRIYGGCYNEANALGVYDSEYYVKGKTVVNLSEGATYTLSYLSSGDSGISACSRHSTNHTDETAVLCFESQTLYSSLESKLGSDYSLLGIAVCDELYIAGVKQASVAVAALLNIETESKNDVINMND